MNLHAHPAVLRALEGQHDPHKPETCPFREHDGTCHVYADEPQGPSPMVAYGLVAILAAGMILVGAVGLWG